MKIPWTTGNYISDCPQKDWIKAGFTIDSNDIRQIVIKAGAKAYYPDGLDDSNNPKYGIKVQGVDKTTSLSSSTATNTYLITMNKAVDDAFPTLPVNTCLGGTYDNTPAVNVIRWWDTTNNIMRATTDGGSTWAGSNITLPIGIAHWESGVGFTDFIPFTFCGCMGNGFFTLPQKIQVGNGFNADNTPNNVSKIYSDIKWHVCTTASDRNLNGVLVVSTSLANLTYNANYFIQDTEPSISNGALWYQPKNNQMWRCANSAWGENTDWMALAYYSWYNTNKRVTEFKPFTNIDSLAKYF